ncbi:M20 family metallopeptidase [Maritalea sp.]|uniref:M20 family metallopeptidase n=1 Tax=Maritalea sp. TaxID=2003361 RepID=UPI003EF104A8
MSRNEAINNVKAFASNGRFIEELSKRVAVPTQSAVPESHKDLWVYLEGILTPDFEKLGCDVSVHQNPVADGGPFLVARRIEDERLPTIFCYGHGDVVQGMEGEWQNDLDPWATTIIDDRIYGRGTADNKGQHTINMLALDAVLKARGRLGFNLIFLVEMSEEIGSPGLREFCAANKDLLKADVLIASDGPRVAPNTPTIMLGVRGAMEFSLIADLRQEDHHSGNWGGIIADPTVVLAHALTTIMDRDGKILIDAWLPKDLPDYVRPALKDCPFDPGESADKPDEHWGEPGLTIVERLCAWNSFDVLAMDVGDAKNPVNAIPKRAAMHCALRFIVGTNTDEVVPALRKHLDKHGFTMIDITQPDHNPAYQASRHDPNLPWVKWAANSVEQTLGQSPQVLPNGAGSLPNDIFCDLLGMPTIWVPHSYNSCGQHAPDEHLLAPLVEEGLKMMTGIFWDAGELGQDFEQGLEQKAKQKP